MKTKDIIKGFENKDFVFFTPSHTQGKRLNAFLFNYYKGLVDLKEFEKTNHAYHKKISHCIIKSLRKLNKK